MSDPPQSPEARNLDVIVAGLVEAVQRVTDKFAAQQALAPVRNDAILELQQLKFYHELLSQLQTWSGSSGYHWRVVSDDKLSPEEKEASEILERIDRELGPLEERTQRLMHQYGL